MGSQIGLLLLPTACEIRSDEDLDEFFDGMRNIRINPEIFYEDTLWFSQGYGHYDFVSENSIYRLYDDYDEEDAATGEPRNTIYVTEEIAQKLKSLELKRHMSFDRPDLKTIILKFNRESGEFQRYRLDSIPTQEMIGKILVSVRCKN